MDIDELLGALSLQEDRTVEVLCRGLQYEVLRAGFSKVVIGLSGGLDSALSAYLARRSFGPENLILVSMPYRSSRPDSLAHAQLVADRLGCELRIHEISQQIDAYFARDSRADRIRRGNKMARERMSILYDLSMAEKALVLGTSNKSELLLGYSTLFGDSASAVNPLGDLYKTQVRQLARHLEIPRDILDKPPSADLWEGQTDESDLGFSYEHVDVLLYHLVDRRQRRRQLLSLGFEPEFVDRVRTLVRASQYKRKLPVIIKISGRTVDKDFLYPRDWSG